MYKRSAIGLAILTAATSCVAPADETRLASAPPASIAPAKTRAVIPAGPPPALLAAAAAQPATDALTITPAPAFVAASRADDAARALACLTAAVYYEARSEPIGGQEAVAQVVLNRVRNPAFPNSVCGTVYEGSSRETGCQFSFTCDGSTAARREPAAWERAKQVAQAALDGAVYAPVGAATYYHTKAVNPWWASHVTKIATIGAHIFYRLPGAWGGDLAFNQHYGGIEPVASAGVHYPEKATAAYLATVVAGVTIHRGSDSVSADAGDDAAVSESHAVVKSAGVSIHRGASGANSSAFGVVVHHADHGPEVAANDR